MESSSSGVEVPTVGRIFVSVEDYQSFCDSYAKEIGFTWNKRSTKWDENRQVTYQILACCRAGYRKSRIDSLKRTNPTSEDNCKARIIVKRNKQMQYVFSSVDIQHNHAMSPSMSRYLRKNRQLTMHDRRMAEVNDEAGVTVRNTYQSLASAVGGYDKLCFTEKDIRNHLTKVVRIQEDGDALALTQYFQRMQDQNRNFYYDIKLDAEHKIEHIFWADARSRAAYEHFGDVVSFDTTYQTNRYDMPFASFVGVNHHGQSVLLGCALLSCEEEGSFIWLFDTWMKCMGEKPPIGILTDQCKAMRNAIEKSLPNTRHRLCIWHILKKIPEKLGGCKQYEEISAKMRHIVWESRSTEAFECSWFDFINIFNLHDNNWLAGLYEERGKWVPIFLNNYFWAGMSSTQRSESMHAFMKGYLTAKSNLQQFVMQYDNCLAHRAQKEYESDALSFNTTIHCATTSPIEKQFQREYTHAKFSELQNEFRAKANCITTKDHVEGYVITYKVIEEVEHDGKTFDSVYEVVFDSSNSDICCQCHLFESKGILCRHTLSVLGLERVKKLPEKYILDRWKKTLKRNHTKIKCSHDSSRLEPTKRRYDDLCKQFYNIAEVAAASEELTETLHRVLDSVWTMLSEPNVSKSNTNDTTNNADDQNSNIVDGNANILEIHNPSHVSRKGRKRKKRLQSAVDKIVEHSRKKKLQSKKRLQKEPLELNISSNQAPLELNVNSNQAPSELPLELNISSNQAPLEFNISSKELPLELNISSNQTNTNISCNQTNTTLFEDDPFLMECLAIGSDKEQSTGFLSFLNSVQQYHPN